MSKLVGTSGTNGFENNGYKTRAMLRFCKRILLTGVIALTSNAAAADVSAQELEGTLWQTEDGKFVIRIEVCAHQEICGDLVWLRKPLDKHTGEIKLDKKNPDEALRDRPVCGLRIIEGLEQDEANQWEDGRLYNPDDGNFYSAVMKVDEETGMMSLRGYIALRALGKTMRLFKLDTPVDTCA